MKKTLLAVLLLLLALMLFACEEEPAHTHTWGEPVIADNCDKVYSCTECTETKTEPHEHSGLIGYHSDDDQHWNACTLAECTAKLNVQAHTWGDPVEVKAPTATEAGERVYVCSVCEHTKKEAVAKLTARMSREDWRAAFAFENVKVTHIACFAGTAETMYYLIDGSLVQLIRNGESRQLNHDSALWAIDFSDYYDDFTFDGSGVYVAEAIVDAELDLTRVDIVISFADGVLEEISYGYAYEGEETGETHAYSFSEWGEIDVLVSGVLNQSTLAQIFAPSNFENYSVTVDHFIVGEFDTELVSSTDWMFDGNSFYGIVYDEEWNGDMQSGTTGNAGWAMLPELAALSEALDASAFQYDIITTYFYCRERIEDFMGTQSDVVLVELGIEDGLLVYLGIKTDANESIRYYFSDYGETEIPNFTLSAQDLAQAFDPANFENYTVSTAKGSVEDMEAVSGEVWMFDGDDYYHMVYDEEFNVEEQVGTQANAGWEMLPELAALSEVLDASDFTYDPTLGGFFSEARIEDFLDWQSDIVRIELMIEDDFLTTLGIETDAGEYIFYLFVAYAETQLPA